MRLYLSSFGLGNRPERLVALVPPRARVKVVVNALDNFPQARDEWLGRERQDLERLGFLPEELDLRDCFGSPSRLERALDGIGLIWITGGNAFLLRRAMRQSGFDGLIHALLSSDRLVYAGFSAAACCAGLTLRGLECVDDPTAVTDRYDRETIWDGLGLIGKAIAVHFQSLSPEGSAIKQTVADWKSRNVPHLTLRDGEALVVSGEHVEAVG